MYGPLGDIVMYPGVGGWKPLGASPTCWRSFRARANADTQSSTRTPMP